MTWLALLRNWKLILGGLALGAALIWGAIGHMGRRHYQKLWTNEKAAHVADNTRWTEAQALANARATSAKLAKEAHDAQITKEINDARKGQRARDDVRLADYLRLHRATGASQGSAGKADLPGTSAAAGQPEGAGSTAAVDGRWLAVCAANTRDLLNAREWAAKTWNPQEANR